MEIIKLIIAIAALILSLASSIIPLVVKLYKANEARKNAETEAEKEKAINDMFATAQALVENAEIAFAGFDAVMKAQGSTAGGMKKENVLTKLQTYALQNGYDFDADYWNAQIDAIVAFTRKVNAAEPTKTV